MGFLEGVEVFDSQPLDSSRIGTLDNPVLVYSLVSLLLSFFLRRFSFFSCPCPCPSLRSV